MIKSHNRGIWLPTHVLRTYRATLYVCDSHERLIKNNERKSKGCLLAPNPQVSNAISPNGRAKRNTVVEGKKRPLLKKPSFPFVLALPRRRDSCPGSHPRGAAVEPIRVCTGAGRSIEGICGSCRRRPLRAIRRQCRQCLPILQCGPRVLSVNHRVGVLPPGSRRFYSALRQSSTPPMGIPRRGSCRPG